MGQTGSRPLSGVRVTGVARVPRITPPGPGSRHRGDELPTWDDELPAGGRRVPGRRPPGDGWPVPAIVPVRERNRDGGEAVLLRP
ncbi:hypothetical protein UO65_6671 [Actinokineospora spheciospongiae]|uniref:Uncharacterized protein n=1 Tax=Actinokineospora spheciospongiae TaxID=909613 RepID=W7IBB3_9PSEU|nr:hypothetical protein UO65_6671 [Actinokineospora spheciospongiae]